MASSSSWQGSIQRPSRDCKATPPWMRQSLAVAAALEAADLKAGRLDASNCMRSTTFQTETETSCGVTKELSPVPGGWCGLGEAEIADRAQNYGYHFGEGSDTPDGMTSDIYAEPNDPAW